MKKCCLIAALCIFSTLSVFAQLPPPENYTLKKDVIYTTQGNWNGRMDIYRPRFEKLSCPLLIFIHGGGWVHGRKEDETAFADFFTRGYIVANIEYRLANVAPAPAAIQDVRSAMAYLALHKDSLGIDTRNVIIMGSSAGAHLALMGGLLGENRIFDLDKQAPRLPVKAIIDKYGPADVLHYEALFKANKVSSAWMGNRGTDTAFINSISPMSYIKRNIPPILIIHGDNDKTVPITQSHALVEAILKQKGKVEYYIVKGGKHGNFSEPEKTIVANKILAFADAMIQSKVTRKNIRYIK